MGAKEITIYQGDALKMEFAVVDQDGKVLDLTSYDVMKFMVKVNKDDADSAALLSKILSDMTVISLTQGRINLQIDGDDTKAITVGQNYYEFVIEIAASKTEYTVLQDFFNVLEKVIDVS